jgi:hypothetical protein
VFWNRAGKRDPIERPSADEVVEFLRPEPRQLVNSRERMFGVRNPPPLDIGRQEFFPQKLTPCSIHSHDRIPLHHSLPSVILSLLPKDLDFIQIM